MSRLPLVLFLVTFGCAGRDGRTTLPAPVDLPGMRFEAEVTDEGVVVTTVDPEILFNEALAAQRAHDCERAEAGYRRIAEDFPESRLAPGALYNAGLCYVREGQPERARALYALVVERFPDGRDGRHARFQLATIAIHAERWDEALALSDTLLTNELDADERMEAMVRRAQALLGQNRLPEALRASQAAVRYLASRPETAPVDSRYFAALGQFTLGEAHRRTAETIVLPPGEVHVQRPFLDRRAEHVLAAQRAYFDTIATREPELAAMAGHRIGSLYDAFFAMIVHAPAPPPPTELTADNPEAYEREYRRSLAIFAKPLLRHSIRYWELALMLIERNGVPTEWTDRINADLVRVRALLAELPEAPDSPPNGS